MDSFLSERVRVALVQHLFISAREYGLPCQTMLDGSGLDPKKLKDPQGEVPAFHLSRMLDTGLAVSGDPLLGLHLARYAKLDAFGVLGSLIRSADTLKTILDRVNEYAGLIGTQGTIWQDVRPGSIVLNISIATASRHYQRHATEYLLAAVLRCIQKQMVEPMDLSRVAVEFQHPRPPATNDDQYAVLLGESAVKFNCATSALIIPVEFLKKPLLHADPFMHQTMKNLAEKLLSVSVDFSILDQAGGKLRAMLQDGGATREKLAESMGMSARQLNRKLSQHGYSYRSLLEQNRREVAMQLLRDTDYTLEVVARKLDYGTSQALVRWFRKSVGVTPARFRAQARQALGKV